ncbi:MAG: homoserine kinase [Pseudomonadales bacterium]
MAVVTELPNAVVADVVGQYDIGSLVAYWPANDGVENTNYFVRTNDDVEYVLTVVESKINHNDLMIRILDLAHRNGLPVAPVMSSKTGAREIYLADKPILLAPRLPGRHVSRTNETQCSAIGKFLAMLHLTTSELSADAHEHPRNLAWLDHHAALSIENQDPAYQRELQEALDNVRVGLEQPEVQELPMGIVHGDLFRDNALFNERELSGVVDFHHASRHYWIYDVAVAINDWCTTDQQHLDKDRTAALVRGYQEVRPFDDAEVACFPTFGLYSAVAFWLSRLVATPTATESRSIKSKDPEEFRLIAAQHARGRFLF